MPKSLSKFRQGFGRLMRRESDRGCVFVLDGRALDPRHRAFLRELPVANVLEHETGDVGELAKLVRGDTDHCVREALRHMRLEESVRERGLDTPFDAFTIEATQRDEGSA
jgi:hypothetical protein